MKVELGKLNNQVWADNGDACDARETKDNVQEAKKIVDNCKHENVVEFYGSAKCKYCEQTFGWYCPKSPDKSCHYPNPHDKDKHHIVLINDSVFALSEKQVRERIENEHMRDDWCMFCGEPDERK